MKARSRNLAGVDAPPDLPNKASSSIDSNVVVIVGSLLCALICILGLLTVARCAWIRRFSSGRQVAGQPAANRGVRKKVLKSLPRLTYGKDSELQEANLSDCAICLAEFVEGEQVRVLPQCGHGFHVTCIDMWLGSHSSCPSCRMILRASRCRKCGGLPVETCSAVEIRPEPRENPVSSSSSHLV